MLIAPNVLAATDAAIDLLMTETKAVRAVVVSTEDGFEVASRVENTAMVSRLSAMASSLAALGALAGEESQLGACESLVMQSTGGFVVISQVPRSDVSLIISVIAGREAIAGQVLYCVKQAARTLELA